MRTALLLLLTLALACHCYGIGIAVSAANVRMEADSLVVELSLDMSAVSIRSNLAYWYSPVLRSTGRYLVLPPIVVSGKQRARADRRTRYLNAGRGTSGSTPYQVLKGNSRKKNNTVNYRIAVSYNPWMDHATLSLMQESKNCCRLSLIGIDLLINDLALTGGFTLPRTQSGFAQKGFAQPGFIRPDTLGSNLTAEKSTATPPPSKSKKKQQQAEQLPQVKRSSQTQPLPCAECTAMVSYLTPDIETDKQRSETTTLHIDYPLNVYEVRCNYRQNAAELSKLDSLLRPLTTGDIATLRQIAICGYASPEGAYTDNQRLASQRSNHFRDYMLQAYHLPQTLFDVTYVAEDWDGLVVLLNEKHPPYTDEALALIARHGVFEGREKRLMDLRGGVPYQQMQKHLFPLLRCLRVTVGYKVRALNVEEAARMIYTHPRMLSLQEMYRVASFYRPGTEQYREIYEIAAFHFPNDVVANVNAASAVIMAGDPISAYQYLEKVKDDPRAWNNLGVMAYLEGDNHRAAEWFRKAAGVEPQKARKNLRKAEERY